jgi:tetratricopeptide (TPR) repeat protein
VSRSSVDGAPSSAAPAPRLVVAVVAAALIAALAGSNALAQDEQFARAAAALPAILEGAYGDEGSRVAAALDELQQGLGEWDRALEEAAEILKKRTAVASTEQVADLHVAMGTMYFRRGRVADALTQFESAARAAPHQARPETLRAIALDALGRSDEAAAAFRRTWQLDPANPARAYLALARSARSAAPDSDVLAPARETLLTASRGALAGGARRQSAPFPDLLATGDNRAPVLPLARYADGVAMIAAGQHPTAIARLREAAAKDPLIVDPAYRTPRMQAGTAALRRGDLPAAVTAFRAASAAVPASSEAHRMLGIVLDLSGKPAESILQFQAALRIRADDERSWIALARVRGDAGEAAQATTTEAGIKAIPASARLRWGLASLYLKLDRKWDALQQYQAVSRLTVLGGAAAIHERIGNLASVRQDLAGAIAAQEHRVRLNEDDVSAHRELADLYLKQGSHDEAFREAAVAVWLDPQDALSLVSLAQAHMAGRRDSEAVEALRQAVSLAPDLREARHAFGQLLIRVGQRDEGRQQLLEYQRLHEAATARDRRLDEIAGMKAEAAEEMRLGKPRRAADVWKRVIASEPDVAGNHRKLAEALLKAGDLAQSLTAFATAAELDGVAAVHLRIATVLERLGRTRESALARQTYVKLRLEDYGRQAGF